MSSSKNFRPFVPEFLKNLFFRRLRLGPGPMRFFVPSRTTVWPPYRDENGGFLPSVYGKESKISSISLSPLNDRRTASV
ncbi:hypothetical protein FoTM2_013486 [Fusarium oxysporum f. sp. vasinfectum]|nr:hypothetical protein FoTM2_013486 [Fusarium oxysporum f. sp. vasinfectum]